MCTRPCFLSRTSPQNPPYPPFPLPPCACFYLISTQAESLRGNQRKSSAGILCWLNASEALLSPRGVMISASGASTPADGGNEALYQLRAALDARERRLEALQSILDKKSEEAAAVHASYSMMYDELQMCAPRITHRPSSARHAACRTRV